MESYAILNKGNSEPMESLNNVDENPVAFSMCIDGSNRIADGASGGSVSVDDQNQIDGSSTGTSNGFNSTRKIRREAGSSVLSNGDGSIPRKKKPKLERPLLVAPIRMVKSSSALELVPVENFPILQALTSADNSEVTPVNNSSKQFWKAGDYEGLSGSDFTSSSVGMDHLRVHPKFLHSNATSHKWALGAFAELLDNSLDEVCNGATFVNVDTLENKKNGGRMLLIEDNGGGMSPDKMRQCMSLGYSSKRKMANTIGQYGNGFKTSTMRLGADVVVFSRTKGNDLKGPTQSIGMLSYTFLRGTRKEDIVVPMVDYEFRGECWNKLMRSEDDWNRNLEAIVEWSPYANKEDLFEQFNFLKDHGTRIVIYNLWEDEEGNLELDFDADIHDIQITGINRDEKNIKMAQLYPNSLHFLTYRHSLRIYASILYLRLPEDFRIILRGKDVKHHNTVNDLMLTKEITYRPQQLPTGISQKNSDMLAMGTVGFVKDARSHIDVQGFNVYHKNRLIKPFWRVWNAAGSDGRGVIGVLEANFVEPAHDKQSFERTIVLSRLEARLVKIQKDYWSENCQEVGYAPRRNGQNGKTRRTVHTKVQEVNVNSKTYISSPQQVGDSIGGVEINATSNLNTSIRVKNNARSNGVNTYSLGETPMPNGVENNGTTGNLHQLSPFTINSEGETHCNDAASLGKVKEERREDLKRLMDSRLVPLLDSFNKERYCCDSLKQVERLNKELEEAKQQLEEKDKQKKILTEQLSKRDHEVHISKKGLVDSLNTISKLLLKISELENCNNDLSTSKNNETKNSQS